VGAKIMFSFDKIIASLNDVTELGEFNATFSADVDAKESVKSDSYYNFIRLISELKYYKFSRIIINDWNLGDEKVKIFIATLLDNSNIYIKNLVQEFACAGNNLSSATSDFICDTILHDNKSLLTLNLANNNIDDAGMVKLAEFIGASRNIASINLSGNKISDIGAKILMNVLLSKQQLVNIDLSKNPTIYCGMDADFLEFLRKITQFHELKKVYEHYEFFDALNFIRNKDKKVIEYFADYLLDYKYSISNSNLVFDCSGYTDRIWVEMLVVVLKFNYTITNLAISGLRADEIGKVAASLHDNRSRCSE
jgi:hypothetical protein